MVFFPLNFGENFWFSKNFLKGVGSFFHFKGGGGGSAYRGLALVVHIVYLIFFSQFSKII